MIGLAGGEEAGLGGFGADRDGWFARGGLRGREVVGEVGFGLALVEVVLSADLAGDGREAVAVRGVDRKSVV